jgi:uncharacterized protein (TIGR03067 family)
MSRRQVRFVNHAADVGEIEMRMGIVLLLAVFSLASASVPAAGESKELNPEQLVGAWQLVSGERSGIKMADSSTGGIFVITKDRITGMNVDGGVMSVLSYKLDVKQSPPGMTLRIEEGFPGMTREAIVDVKDGKLLLCYNLDGKGRPKSFVTTKDGNNDRSMVFVPSDDPREAAKEIKALSEKKWLAFRDEDATFFNGSANSERIVSPRFTLIGRDGVSQDRNKVVLDMCYENGREEPPKVSSPEPFYKPKKKDPQNKIDSVMISEQALQRFGDSIIETGRSVATRKDQEAPVWDVRYTSVWVREKNQWRLVSEQQTPVK